MGCFNWFFKFLAVLLMILVVIFLPITVFANEIGDLLFSTDNIFTVVDEELITPEFMESVLSEALVMIQESGDGAEADVMRESIMSVVDEIPADTINEVVTILLPIDILGDLFGEFSEGFYTWLDSDSSQSDITISLIPLKNNISENGLAALTLVMESLPVCTEADLAGGKWNMNCKPPEEFIDQIFEGVEDQLELQLSAIPDVIDMDKYLSGQNGDLFSVRNSLILVKDILNYVWVLVLGLFLVGIVLGARTFQGFFSWAGWPLLLASLFILMFGILLGSAATGIINFGLTYITVDFPDFVLSPMYSIISSVFGLVGSGLISKGLIIFAAGILSIITGLLISYYREKNAEIPRSDVGDNNLLSDIQPIEQSSENSESEE